VKSLERAKIPYRLLEYECEAVEQGFGSEIARKLDLEADRVFKTLVVRTSRGELVLAVVPVSGRLNLKRLAKAVGDKNAELAERAAAERATGYVRGGITALGTRRRLPVVLDATASSLDRVVISGGRRGLSIELDPRDFVRAADALIADLLDAT
jgi:Cys-tRNA(Pro)/Cys-tRNA(Cys) deacylase